VAKDAASFDLLFVGDVKSDLDVLTWFGVLDEVALGID
jgi:hypothetical protein